MKNWKFSGGLAAAAMTAAIVAPAEAQLTSSNVNGRVVDANGAPVAGAVVSVTHAPSGQTKTAVTSSTGVFFESGLRVGGPYTFDVSSDAGVVTRDDVFLQPGTGNSISLTLEGERTLDAIIISGDVGSTIELNNGVGSVYSLDDILNQPSSERDLVATLVRDPLAFSTGEGQLNIAGANARFNGLAIDGSLQQNDFGLGSSTYATSRSPISLDVVESASISASDYSVTASGFTGGLINVVTKSGTNDWDGSLYYYRQDEDYLGNTAFDQFIEQPAFKEEEYGFTLGGPIIKDKLFFFAAYDEFESGSGQNFTGDDAQDEILDTALFDGIRTIINDTYGFDVGERPLTTSNPETSERTLGKLDWIINDNHRASFTYQNTKESETNVDNLSFSSANYSAPQELTAYTGQLFSDWTNNLSTEVRVNFKEFERGQDCGPGSTVGEWRVALDADDLVGTAFEGALGAGADVEILGGCDAFRQGNTFEDERLQLYGAANYTWGDHFVTFGGEWENYELDNLFAQSSAGVFLYEDLTQLANSTPEEVTVRRAATGNLDDIRAVWGYDKLALFVQDSWQILPNFRLDYGIRYERFIQDDEPEARSFFEQAYGFSNDVNLDGNDLFMPRVSFEYLPFERTKLTGGFGLYAGGDPKVWTSNAFTPPAFEVDVEGLSNVNPADGAPQQVLDVIALNSADDPGPIDVISEDFETPSDWKASLKLDQEFDLKFDQLGLDLGDDYLISLQALYVTTNDGFRWTNLGQTDIAAAQPVGVAPDGRPIYADLDALGVEDAIALTNFDDSDSLILSASLSKEYDNGVGFVVSYAHQDVETVTPGTSSRGISNFRAIFDTDRNNPSAARSPFEVEHAFKMNLSYEKEIFGDLLSTFNLFGQAFSGEPFSYTFNVGSLNVNGSFENNALFGRSNSSSPFDNDLLYVPTISGGAISDPLVAVGSGFNEAAFVDFVQTRGLGSGIIDRNSDDSPWTQRWDFQWQQELPLANLGLERFEGNKLKFVLDIRNVANLLNDEWGTDYNGQSFDGAAIVTADLVSATDVATLGVDNAPALVNDQPRTTCMAASDCVYRFRSFSNRGTGFADLDDSVYEIRVGLRYEF